MKKIVFLALMLLLFVSCGQPIETKDATEPMYLSPTDRFIVDNLDSLPQSAYHLCAVIDDKVYIMPSSDKDPDVLIVKNINVGATILLILVTSVLLVLLITGVAYFISS